jgi:hypothetical protein
MLDEEMEIALYQLSLSMGDYDVDIMDIEDLCDTYDEGMEYDTVIQSSQRTLNFEE